MGVTMGITITAKDSEYDFSCGYHGFMKLRENIANAWDEEFGMHYENLNLYGGGSMKIIVDKMPQSPKECFYAHCLKSEYPTCWCVTGDSDWSTELCSLGCGKKCPYITEMKGENNV